MESDLTTITQFIIMPTQRTISTSVDDVHKMLMIKSFLKTALSLHEALLGARSSLLVQVQDVCRPEISREIVELIDATIDENATYAKNALDLRDQRTYAVKVNSALVPLD
jgi:DNA mismatch repair protein MSH4